MERLTSRLEAQAWFTLAVIGLALATFGVLIPVLGAWRAAGAFGLLGLLGVTPLFTLRRRGDTAVVADERDRLIHSRATLIAFAVFWVAFVGACMIPWAVYRKDGSVPVDLLPLIVLAGWVVFSLTQSAAMLVQYHQGRRDVRG
jgi:uncharacterized membrane protein